MNHTEEGRRRTAEELESVRDERSERAKERPFERLEEEETNRKTAKS